MSLTTLIPKNIFVANTNTEYRNEVGVSDLTQQTKGHTKIKLFLHLATWNVQAMRKVGDLKSLKIEVNKYWTVTRRVKKK